MTAALKLGRPDDWGNYRLSDDSMVYASVRPGEFFCWLRTGDRHDNKGRRLPDGEVLFGKGTIQYHEGPAEALARLNQERRRRGLA